MPELPGVVLAQNDGANLVILSIDPGRPGENAVTVDLRDARGVALTGDVMIAADVDGRGALSATFPVRAHRSLTIATTGQATFGVHVVSGSAFGATANFSLSFPVTYTSPSQLSEIDAAMRALHTLREEQTLTSGQTPLLFHFEYVAPDRVRYTLAKPGAAVTETRLIGRDRFDRDGGGPWTRTDAGIAVQVPASSLAPGATHVVAIGSDAGGAEPLVELAFVQPGGVFYRVWSGTRDHLVRRYTMMTTGHYMTGAYSDFNLPVVIGVP